MAKQQVSKNVENGLKAIAEANEITLLDTAEEPGNSTPSAEEIARQIAAEQHINAKHDSLELELSKREAQALNTLVVSKREGLFTTLSVNVDDNRSIATYNGVIVHSVTTTRFSPDGLRTKDLLGYCTMVEGKPIVVEPNGSSFNFRPMSEFLFSQSADAQTALYEYSRLMKLVSEGKFTFGVNTLTTVIFATHMLKDELDIIRMSVKGELPENVRKDEKVLAWYIRQQIKKQARANRKAELIAFALARKTIEG